MDARPRRGLYGAVVTRESCTHTRALVKACDALDRSSARLDRRSTTQTQDPVFNPRCRHYFCYSMYRMSVFFWFLYWYFFGTGTGAARAARRGARSRWVGRSSAWAEGCLLVVVRRRVSTRSFASNASSSSRVARRASRFIDSSIMATFEVALERVERPSASGKAYAVERGVVAPRGAAAGRALMTCAPYAAVVRRELAGEVCAETFRRLRAGEGVEASSSSSETANAVSAVPRSRFVGTRARDAANARGFDVAETLARASARGLPSNEVRMALQCLARRDAEARGDLPRERYALLGEDGFRGVLALHEGPSSATPDGGASPRALEKYVQIRSAARVAVALACGAMRSGITPEEIEERMERGRERGVDDECVLGLLSRLEVNGFTIADDDHQRLGFGIYPDAALFNQSLVPNAQVMFAGTRLVIKALRDISPGEEVTIAYSEQYAPRERTRRLMRESYAFDPYDSFANAVRADEARERAIRYARRVPAPSGDAEHVDLGEEVCWYGGDLLPDDDLARDSFWHALLDPSNANHEWDLTAGVMFVKGEPDDASADGERRANVDEVFTWGRFPPNVDRELTALNVIRAARAIDALTRDAENGEIQRAIAEGGTAAAGAARDAFAAAETLLNGGRDVAGVGPRHELRKQLRLARTVVFPNMDDFEALEKTYESCVGWSEFDTVYVHLRFMLFKIGFHAIDARVRAKDGVGLKRLMKKQILTHNFLKGVMSSASCSGMVMYEEWARAREGYARDLTALRELLQS